MTQADLEKAVEVIAKVLLDEDMSSGSFALFDARLIAKALDDAGFLSAARDECRPRGHCQIIDGEIDDVSVHGLAHLERVDAGSFYLGLYRPDGSGYQIWLTAKKGKITINHDEITPPMLSAAQGGGDADQG